MKATITYRGVLLENPDPETKKRLVRDLTVAPISHHVEFPRPFKVFATTGPDAYVVPLHWARSIGVVPTDARAPPPTVDGGLRFSGTLRGDQPGACDKILETLEVHGAAVCNMYAGGGKTVVGLHVAASLGLKTMILVHKRFLMDQWAERVGQYLPGARVTYVQGDRRDTSGDVVIASVQTLLSRRHAFDDIGLLIVDEVHHYSAAAFSQVMLGLCPPRVLGLSATLVRKDGLTRVVHWFCGPVAFSSKRTGHDEVTVLVKKYSDPIFRQPPPTNRRGDLCYTTFLTSLTKLEARTRLIATEARKLELAGRKVLVLSHRRGHAAAVCELLRSMGSDAATYLGGDKAAPDCAVTCATYALISEGYDDASLSGLVLGTPSSDIVQAAGRVLRGHAFQDPVIVDVVDEFGVCYAQFTKRKRYYKATGFRIVVDTMDASSPSPEPEAEFEFVDDE